MIKWYIILYTIACMLTIWQILQLLTSRRYLLIGTYTRPAHIIYVINFPYNGHGADAEI